MKNKVVIALCFSLTNNLLNSSYALTITPEIAQDIEYNLRCSAQSSLVFPSEDGALDNLIVEAPITWQNSKKLILRTQKDIIFRENGTIHNTADGSLFLEAGFKNSNNTDTHTAPSGRVYFPETSTTQIKIDGEKGEVRIYYNPLPVEGRKEINKYVDTKHLEYAKKVSVKTGHQFSPYMWVHNIRDLWAMRHALFRNYALAQNIDASETKEWDKGRGFPPIKRSVEGMPDQPFSGRFDGRGFTISNLYINRPTEDSVGLFGKVAGTPVLKADINDLTIENATVKGRNYAGVLGGIDQFTTLNNINIINCNVEADEVAGGVVGVGQYMDGQHLYVSPTTKVNARSSFSPLFGVAEQSYFGYITDTSFPDDSNFINSSKAFNIQQNNIFDEVTLCEESSNTCETIKSIPDQKKTQMVVTP